MSKPIISFALTILWEKGLVKLDDPISLYLPAFKDVKVAIENQSKTEIVNLISGESPITIQDLLRPTSGLSYGFLGPKAAFRKSYNVLYTAGLRIQEF